MVTLHTEGQLSEMLGNSLTVFVGVLQKHTKFLNIKQVIIMKTKHVSLYTFQKYFWICPFITQLLLKTISLKILLENVIFPLLYLHTRDIIQVYLYLAFF